MPDIARLDALLAWAEAENLKKEAGLPSEWDQSFWILQEPSCGTACCIAGKVALEDGLEPILQQSSRRPGSLTAFEVIDKRGREVDPGDYAEEALGLTYDQAGALFDEDNGIDEIRSVIGQIKAGELYPDRYEV